MQPKKNNLQWLEYDLLKNDPFLTAYTFLRHGGSSEGAFSSLNLSDRVGDNPESVKTNRALVLDFMKNDNIVFANQTHSNVVMEVTEDNMNQTFDCDALVTKEKGIPIAITHADCQATFFFDPEYQVIAAVHAGWKGLTKNIYQNTITFMHDNYNTRPESLIACISPSLGPDHAEFRNFKQELPKSFWDYETKKEKNFDLWQIAIDQLKDAGMLEKNIEVAGECTYSNDKDYFSFRKEKQTGRNASIICLNK